MCDGEGISTLLLCELGIDYLFGSMCVRAVKPRLLLCVLGRCLLVLIGLFGQ